ncbi:hypothetical protein MOB34_11285 [Bacillus spizizenii]|uniref:hypothetical protein n=1 Tax=Bacillus cabrialesii TaxID=2487276 RepID=UPI000C9FC4F7|nr:hypothetical protein [Bacillus cabrialesii]AUS12143.1 hypothetical protein C0W65_08900 [Bacillus subtilis]MCY7824370.1 hypothetical protein [Bacillus spizizenii]MBU2659367.1 hypothetical protein [Bacillus cabrialesii]MCY8228671.1 hypothetical protein [Bacillus spizizenii]MCY8887282.1 hypothetical protein [Bacillus spizizenii]
MKKIKFYLSQNLFHAANKPIREKSDVIELLLNTIPEILIDESVDKNLGFCEVIVDKMSRIVYTLQRDEIIYKKFSFAFPFYLKENSKEGFSKWIICDNSGEYLNSQVISILFILFNEGLFNENISVDIEPLEFYERILQAIKEIEAEIHITEVLIWHFIRKLFLFEPGYIRYDFDDDVARCNEITHPLHHLDFYFSSNATMKIGVAKNNQDFEKWKEDSFENLLNVKSPCYYLKM